MAWKTLFNEVEFLAQYPMVGLAITDSTTPVPGYLYGEINAITYMNNGNNCKALVNFLICRLQASTPLVSIKVLKLLLHLVRNGHSEMTEEVKLHEVALKDARRFHGPPDDLHGNSFYENIRKMAKELLDVIFAENKDTVESTSYSGYSELAGYGSNASLKKMSGFGYSIKTQKTVTEKVSDGITSFVEKLLPSNEKDTQSLQMHNLSDALPRYKPIVIDKSQSDHVLPFVEENVTTNASFVMRLAERKNKVHIPGRAGGGWEDSEDDDDIISDPLQENAAKESSMSVDSLENSKGDSKVPDSLEEHKIVEEFTVDEPLEKLQYSSILLLCKRCCSLNCDQVLIFLIKKLSESEENVQLRALVFIEYLLFHDVITLESLTKIVIPPLQKLTETEDISSNPVKLKAKKICLTVRNLSNIVLQHSTQQTGRHIKCCN